MNSRNRKALEVRAAMTARWPDCNFVQTGRLDACRDPGGCLTGESKCRPISREEVAPHPTNRSPET